MKSVTSEVKCPPLRLRDSARGKSASLDGIGFRSFTLWQALASYQTGALAGYLHLKLTAVRFSRIGAEFAGYGNYGKLR